MRLRVAKLGSLPASGAYAAPVKVAGILTMVAGLLLGVLMALVPTSVSLLGTSASCGPPALRVLATEATGEDEFGIGQGLVNQCVQQSWVRLGIGIVLCGIAGVAGLAMVVGAPKPNRSWAGAQGGPSAQAWQPYPPAPPGYRPQAYPHQAYPPQQAHPQQAYPQQAYPQQLPPPFPNPPGPGQQPPTLGEPR